MTSIQAGKTGGDLSSLAIHTITLKQWDLPTCLGKLADAGVGGVSVWREAVEAVGLDEAVRQVKASGLKVPALVRGGFFVAFDENERNKAHDRNRRAIDEAHAIGAEMVVIVAGAVPGMPLADARGHVRAGLEAVVGHADQAGVKLAIEPLHPMYAADRSCINRLSDALDVCESVGHAGLGVAVDVYHVWWDPDAPAQTRRAAETGRLFGYHVCDWKTDTKDLLLDRGLMGEGVIDLPAWGGLVRDLGFDGHDEVEIFSNRHWSRDPDEWLGAVVAAWRGHCRTAR